MSYSVTAILSPYEDAHKLHCVSIQVVFNRVKIYPATSVKVKKNQWKDGAVIKHTHKDKYNFLINQKKTLIEGLLLEAMKYKSSFTKNELVSIITGEENVNHLRFDVFAYSRIEEMNNKLSEGRVRQYRVIVKKVLSYDDKTLITDINGAWLQKFENWLHSKNIQAGTIKNNINIVKAIVRAADNKELATANFKGYKNIQIHQSIPEYLTEEERDKFYELVKLIDRPSYKVAGYYYLLSCLTGYRLGDAKRFDYNKMVKDGNIIIRATKNNTVVSLKIYPKLKEVLEYVKDHPLNLSEDKIRKYVKEICSLAGIKKNISFHSSRHGFSMFLLKRGFSIDEVAQLLGDSPNVARVYARINNEQLNRKVNELLN